MPRYPTRRAALSALAAAATLLIAAVTSAGPARADAAAGTSLAREWIVPPAEARALIGRRALVLDARDDELKAADPAPGAVPVTWPQFSEPDLPTKGRLLADDAELGRRLRAVGVRSDTPVVVLADPLKGWGEDGRIAWMLRALGHDAAVAVDGGLPALRAAGLPAIAAPSLPGDFVVRRRADLVVTREELRAGLGRPGLVVLDTREPREFAGETPYGESRGGHVPGARHVWYKDLLAPDGGLLPPERLRARLAELGVTEDAEVVSYCTGGIRSGWVTAVLNDLGYKARNFAGSMWDWSAGGAAEYPLVASR
jgi:thiosulfate/3-mercaptopyruvate sulfurtransferase